MRIPSYQLSVISYQLSVISYQLSVISYIASQIKNRKTTMKRHLLPIVTTIAVLFAAQNVQAQFSKTTIDFGVVVSDLEKSLAFYTDVVGFTRVGNFSVNPDMANDAGLTNITKPLKIEKLMLGADSGATTLKLMQIDDPNQQKPANDTIHASLGMSYMTLFVTDTKASLARAAEHGVQPLKKGPVDLGGGKVYLTLLKDPDGNFVELVGPLTK
jgi:catechol 2,3-dioxygenase-like lactoylglutathione lyase family enzyme